MVNSDFDLKTLEVVNPIFNTAKMTAFQLAATGDEDAKKLIDILKLSFEGTQTSAEGSASEKFLQANYLIMETRFRTMFEMAKKSGCPTEVDLPCGYTPRAMKMAREGIRFVGLDLPAAISEAEPAIMSLLDEKHKDLVHFFGVDATNYNSLRAALNDVTGPICITTEGLLMYFMEAEAVSLCNNVRKLLEEFGGCWMTPDPECVMQFIAVSRTILGDEALKLMFSSKKLIEGKSDVSVGKNFMSLNYKDFEGELKNCLIRLNELGFKVERIPISDNLPELRSFEKLSPEQVMAIKAAYSKVCYWRLTLLDETKKSSETFRSEALNYMGSIDDGRLTISLSGRLDTLSAPALLSYFEQTDKENSLSGICLDFASLDYISSAGLRILLIIKKRFGDSFSVININDECLTILAQTGFAEMLGVSKNN